MSAVKAKSAATRTGRKPARKSASSSRRASRAVDQIRIKRAYAPAIRQDGCRVLVDRIWPRGVSKDALRIDHWLKEVAPSTALRAWFGHDPRKWDTFRARYYAELEQKPDEIAFLQDLVRRGVVTLVYAARDESHNNAQALAEFLIRAK